MKGVERKILATLRYLLDSEKEVSRLWIFRMAGRLDQQFMSSERISFDESGEFLQVTARKNVFFWPKESPRRGLLQVLSEIFNADHPHHYLWKHTKIDPEDVVLDIGACEGAFSASVTSKCTRVIAIEPSRTMCKLMEGLFRVRGEPCPEILNCLVGGEPGKAYFWENKTNPGESRITAQPVSGAYELPVRTLDEIIESLQQKVTFIKCDAEGAEPLIFAGGRRFLSAHHPKLAITTYHNDGDYAEMRKLLISMGYRVAGKGLFYTPSARRLRVQMIHAW